MNDSALFRCGASADIAFGPSVAGCRNNFDFTITFEQYFFSIVPSALFILTAPLRFHYLSSKQDRVDGKALRSIKLVAIGIFACLQLVTVIVWATQNHSALRVTASVASGLSFIASLFLCGLSYLEHSRSLRPSILLNAYLFLTLLLDAVVLRTSWLTAANRLSRNIFTASFALKGVIVFLEAKEKRPYLRCDEGGSPEDTSGLYSQTFLWWLNSIIKQGFGHILKPTDLYPMDESLSSETLNGRFWQEWHKPHRKRKHDLAHVITKTLRWPLILPIFPRLALLGFTFCQPLLVGRLLDFLQMSDDQKPMNIGYGLVGAYAIVYFGMAVSNSLYSHRNFKFLTMLRGTLVSAIYSKTTEISVTALNDSAAVTLMSTDVERLVKGLRGMHDLWANSLQFILATWLLEEKLGWACIAPILVTAVSAAITLRLSSTTQKTQLKWVMKIQKRVGVTSTMLRSIKGIKMAGLTKKLTDLVQALREDEVKNAGDFWLLGSFTSTLAQVPLMISPVATFAIFAVIAAKDHTTLDAPRLFASLSLLLLLTQPLFSLFTDIVDLRATFGCFRRIEEFLLSDTKSDYRLISSSPSMISSQASIPNKAYNNRTWAQSTEDIELVNITRTSGTPTKISPVSNVIRVRDGAFGWNSNEEPILQDINFDIGRSELTFLIGPVASGKSTLLKAFLGETQSSKGFVHISTFDIAWCEQTPWLSNSSVQKNIIGFANFNQELYRSVVHGCDLESDLESFPNGDQTIIGSNGISLSSGQKQRIAIARAVYSQRKLAIFDDVFSSMDATTQHNVFDRLLGPRGLLRQWKTTVIVATHAVNLLPHADRIIALGSNGKILEQGTFAELNARSGYVRSFCLKSRDQGPLEETTRMDGSARKAPTSSQRNVSELPSSMDKARQIGDWSIYRYYFQAIGWKLTCVFLLLEICWAFFSTFPTIWLKWYTDQPSQHTGYYLGVYAALQATGLAGFALLTWFSFHIVAMKAGTKLHEITLETVMAAPMSFFSISDIGSIVTRFSQDMQLIDGSLPLALMAVVANLLTCVGQMALIASAAYYVAISFPLLLAVFYIVQKYYLRTSRQMRLLDIEEKAPVYTQFIESLGGLATIRAFSWQKPSIEHNHTLVDRSQKPFYLLFMIQTWLTLVLDLITMALAILVVAVAVKMRNTISVGFTGVSLAQIISFAGNMKLCLLFWTQLETSLGAVARVKQFSNDTANENLASENQEPPPNWPGTGVIRIQNISAAYNADVDKALNDISLSICPGEKIGVCGRTGSGKSTLTLALFRMIELTAGRISIDGLDISTLPRHQVRFRLNAIGADPYFLNGTVRMNLDPHGIATDNSMAEALRKVQLWDMLTAKGGLDAEYGDDTFSNGQKQLFCLARAMLRPGKIVVMDEVTSNVDLDTDALMQSLIRSEFQRCTLITIAHRIETILDYDRVVVMDKGMIAEIDSPQVLLQQDSIFRRLYESSQVDREEKGKERTLDVASMVES